MTIIDGKQCAVRIKEELKTTISELHHSRGTVPKLAVILVGEDPASKVYVGMKGKACIALGIESRQINLPKDTTQNQLIQLINELNGDDTVNGILVQMPVPDHIDNAAVIHAISPLKDVDCFHPENTGLLMAGAPRFSPCTPLGICRLLKEYSIKTSGADITVIGRSGIVGRPLSVMLSQKSPEGNATVTICHSRTKDISFYTRRADIIIVAIGKPHFLTADMVSPGAAVIDVGVNRLENGKLAGDADFDALKDICSAITPVPGGVGPMTIAMLMNNTVEAYQLQNQ